MKAFGLLRMWFALAFLAVLMVGCGGNKGAEYKTAPAKGKVMYQGQPVTAGIISLQPKEVAGAAENKTGRPATGEIQSDGTFVLSTYQTGDGAVIGKHRVTFMPKAAGAESYEDRPTPSPYVGLTPKEQEVEIKPGGNELTIELVPMPR